MCDSVCVCVCVCVCSCAPLSSGELYACVVLCVCARVSVCDGRAGGVIVIIGVCDGHTV